MEKPASQLRAACPPAGRRPASGLRPPRGACPVCQHASTNAPCRPYRRNVAGGTAVFGGDAGQPVTTLESARAEYLTAAGRAAAPEWHEARGGLRLALHRMQPATPAAAVPRDVQPRSGDNPSGKWSLGAGLAQRRVRRGQRWGARLIFDVNRRRVALVQRQCVAISLVGSGLRQAANVCVMCNACSRFIRHTLVDGSYILERDEACVGVLL